MRLESISSRSSSFQVGNRESFDDYKINKENRLSISQIDMEEDLLAILYQGCLESGRLKRYYFGTRFLLSLNDDTHRNLYYQVRAWQKWISNLSISKGGKYILTALLPTLCLLSASISNHSKCYMCNIYCVCFLQ